MDTRRIGALEVSVAGLGGNNFGRRLDAEGVRRVVDAALEAGVTLFDTADIYGDGASEELLGRALGARRDRVVVTSKFGMGEPPGGLPPGHPTSVARACDDSLNRLGTDRIDLYLFHRPDPATPVGETLAAMDALRREGKVREIGCSNFSAAQLDEAAATAAERGLQEFVCVQNEFSLLERAPEREGVLDACARLGLAFVPYFPLASGLLSGKYRQGRPVPPGTRLGGPAARPAEQVVDEQRLAVVERLAVYAEERGHTLLELALSWLADHREVASAIAGAMTPEQVSADVAAVSAWALTDDERFEVDRLVAG